jgi:hypothetical protein
MQRLISKAGRMAHAEKFPLRRPVQIVMLWVIVFAFGLALMLSGWKAIAEFRGATVDAEVVGITTNAPGRRVYDVRLVTRSGLVCATKVDSGSNPPPREIHLGGLSRVHYLVPHPCADYSAQESTSTPSWQFAVLAALAVAGGLIGLRQLRRNR